MLFATGSVSRFQVPSVASTHSARDQARPISPVDGRSVTGSSHSSARRRASSTSRDCWEVTDGSEPLAATRRALSCASVQLTGPSDGALIMAWTWENIWASRLGSFGRPAALASSAGSKFSMPLPPIRFCSISVNGSFGVSSPFEELSGLEVMIPPIVGVTVAQPSRYPGGPRLSAAPARRSLWAKSPRGPPPRTVVAVTTTRGGLPPRTTLPSCPPQPRPPGGPPVAGRWR